MEKIRVLVLMGGTSGEREVSLATGDQVINAISNIENMEPIAVEISKTGQWLLGRGIDEFSRGSILELSNFYKDRSLKVTSPLSKGSLRIDIAFIALHGKDGEDGAIQGFLEASGVPYTGSGILASAVAMSKQMSKLIFKSLGFKTPKILAELVAGQSIPTDLKFPVVVTPNGSGSSLGVTICQDNQTLKSALDVAFGYDQTVLIQEFIEGEEYSCGVIDYSGKIQALPVIKIIPQLNTFYDYKSKYEAGGSNHVIPAPISPSLTQEIQSTAIKIHAGLGCLDFSRTDFILTPEKQIYVLEINTIPGMTPTSLLPEAAQVAGISFVKLIEGIVLAGFKRKGIRHG